jgi:hypothetical protein
MELAIGKLIKGTDLVDVLGGPVDSTVNKVGAVKFSLKTLNTVNSNWNIEIYMFYDDAVGETRIPVWFYVRIYCMRRLRTHFSLGNRCSKPSTMPSKEEILQFEAAAVMFDEFMTLSKTNRSKISGDEDVRGMYKLRTAINPPPNQVLQFMDEIEVASDEEQLPICFINMERTNFGGETAYTTFQRQILRKYNRWKNGGLLKSDVPSGNLYPGEPADAWQDLDECGGRASPEVDHIDPAYQGGGNTYINGRLVSFYHNHLYREKKVRGAEPIGEQLAEMYTDGKIALTGENKQECIFIPKGAYDPELYDSVEVCLEHEHADDIVFNKVGHKYLFAERSAQANIWNGQTFAEMRSARKVFLEADLQRALKQQAEQELTLDYQNCSASLAAGLNAFVNNPNHPERLRLEALILAAGIPLCVPSDLLTTGVAGIQNPDADNTFPVVDVADAKLTDPLVGTVEEKRLRKYYANMMKCWTDLKVELGIL